MALFRFVFSESCSSCSSCQLILSIRVHLPRYLRAKVFCRSLPRFLLRQNFSTDFRYSTDKDFAFCILHSAFRTSVSSVQSVVQSSAVAAALPHEMKLARRALGEGWGLNYVSAPIFLTSF